MRWKLPLTFATVAALALLATAGAQEPRPDDQQLIDDFVQTRGVDFVQQGAKKTSAKPAPKGTAPQDRQRRQKGKGAGTQDTAAAKKPAAQGGGTPAAGGGAGPGGSAEAGGAPALKTAGQPIGLGYTLYKIEGRYSVPVSDATEFRKDDEIRLALESNVDGYLYVFNSTNGGAASMLYPHPTVEGGDNRIAARTRQTIPASDTGFVFDATSGVERLYVVLSRRPLPEVPAGAELVALFPQADETTGWVPSAAQWSRLEALFRRHGARGARLPELAQLQPVASDTLTRGLTVKKSAPPPAVVRVSDAPDAELLLTVIDLVHK